METLVHSLLTRFPMKTISALALVTMVGCATEDATTVKTTAALGECGEWETHVVGVYDGGNTGEPGGGTGGDGSSPTGDGIILRVDRPGRHVLVVSAFEAATWRLELAPGAEVEAVYAVGYGQQTVIGAPSSAKIVTESRDQGTAYACGYAYGVNTPVCDTQQLLNLVGKRVHAASSFVGCKSATEFRIGEDLSVTSDCGSDAVYDFSPGVDQTQAILNCNGPDSCGGPIVL
jgi:hypothetical protein